MAGLGFFVARHGTKDFSRHYLFYPSPTLSTCAFRAIMVEKEVYHFEE